MPNLPIHTRKKILTTFCCSRVIANKAVHTAAEIWYIYIQYHVKLQSAWLNEAVSYIHACLPLRESAPDGKKWSVAQKMRLLCYLSGKFWFLASTKIYLSQIDIRHCWNAACLHTESANLTCNAGLCLLHVCFSDLQVYLVTVSISWCKDARRIVQ